MYQTVLFDLDGTLTDPGVGITNCVSYVLEKYNIEVPAREKLYRFIGPPLHESFERFYGFSEEEAKKAVECYRERYRETGIYENKVYDGIEDVLKTLQNSGKKIAVATSKPEEFAVKILEHFHLSQYFLYIAGANMDGTRTKKHEVISYALDVCQVKDKSEVIMVGDREHDVIGASKIGIDSLGVLYGYGDYEELKSAGADYIVKGPKDILTVI